MKTPEYDRTAPIDPLHHSKTILNRSVEDEMETSYLQYSMSVIVARALPDVRDGLKPVHRRILYVMDKNGLSSTSKYTKSAQIVGDVMGKYHPHGDTAIYDAMVRLAQPFSTRYLLVDGQGNFGSLDGDPAAAYRYTEARMTKASEAMLEDIDKDTVNFRDNFDGSQQEPEVLPARLPNLLLNGQMGIAVGMATNIPPHNLNELVDATILQIDKPDATLDDLMEHVKGPDFPTGGIVYGKESIRAAFATGRGGVIVRGVVEIQDNAKGKRQILISEIPYAINKASLVEKIADLVKDKKVLGISDIRDESSRGVVRIVIDLKKDAYPKKLVNQLYKLTPLQTVFHYNMLALIDGIQPRILGLQDVIQEHIKHRQLVVRRRTEFELRKAREREHILQGLKIALDAIDQVIATIRSSETAEDAQNNLMEKFNLSEAQAKAILSMPLRTLAGLERKKIEDELQELIALIAKLEKILGSEQEILRVIKAELLQMKSQFGDDRRTKIVPQELKNFSEQELIPDEQVVVALTTANYIKRTLLSDYRTQNRGGKGKKGITTREEDAISQFVTTSTHDWLLLFTNKGRVFRLKVYEVPASSLSAKGVAVVNLVQLQPDEQVSSMIRVPSAQSSESNYLFMTTVKGVVKKTATEQYTNIRASGLIAIKLDEADELRWVRLVSGKEDVIISTEFGQAVRFNESTIRPMGRAARGIRGIRLRTNDRVVGADVVNQDHSLLVLSRNGYGKMTKLANFPTHKRGGFGIKAAVVNAKTGNLVGVTAVDPAFRELLIISTHGLTLRLGLKDIPLLGRTTQGVRVMRLNGGDTIASLGFVADAISPDSTGDEEKKEVETE